jgi:hypothetical protein
MAIRISESHDKMVLGMMSGMTMSGANKDTLLQNVKTYLDANFAPFKDQNGNYTVPHVKQALTTILSRGK